MVTAAPGLRLKGKEVMPDKRCGTCGWWDDEENGVVRYCGWVQAHAPLPSCIESACPMDETEGDDCRCWKPREPTA